MTRTLVSAHAGAARLGWLRRALVDEPGASRLLLAPSRGAADDLVRTACLEGGWLAGVQRMTLSRLAAELAAPAMARRGFAPVSGLGVEALRAQRRAGRPRRARSSFASISTGTPELYPL